MQARVIGATADDLTVVFDEANLLDLDLTLTYMKCSSDESIDKVHIP